MPLNTCANFILGLHLLWRLKSCWSASAPLSRATVWSSHTVMTKIITRRGGEHWSSEARTRKSRKGGGTWAYSSRHPPAAMLMPDKEVCHMRSVSKLLSMAATWNENDSIALSPSRYNLRWQSPCVCPSDLPRRRRTCLQKVPRHLFTSKAGWEEPIVMLDAHLSFTDDEEGVSSGSLSNDVLSISVMCLSGEKATEECIECAPFLHPQTNLCCEKWAPVIQNKRFIGQTGKPSPALIRQQPTTSWAVAENLE